jgi:hypothetical protein
MDLIKENSNIIIILFYSYILFFHIKDKDYISMLVATLVTVLLLCQMKKNVEGLENDEEDFFNSELTNTSELTNNQDNDSVVQNDFDIVPFEYVNRMGPYDGLCLTSVKDKLSHELVSNENLKTYLGVQGPLESVQTDDNVLTGPSLDGVTKNNKLAILSNNKSSLNCCDESQYSTSTGCICLTDNQKKYIKSRGYNKTSPDLI